MKYMLISYTRSYRYFAPLAFTVVSVLLIYSYRPNPILDSYSVTAALLFIGSAWLGMNFLGHDRGRESMLLIVHAGSPRRYYTVQYLAAVVLSLAMCAFAVLYPILFGMFGEPVTPAVLALSFLGHFGPALTGVSLALYFQSSWMENQGRAAGYLLILIILSLSGTSVVQQLPGFFGFIPYVLPPVSVVVDALMNAREYPGFRVAGTVAYPFVYGSLLFLLYLKFACAKDAASAMRKSG